MDLQTLRLHPLWHLDHKQGWQPGSNTRNFVLLESKGEDNPLSAYLRSVPFSLVLSYYKTMKLDSSPGSTLIDISDWKSEK